MDKKELHMFNIMANIMDMKTGHMTRIIFVYTRKDSEFANTYDGLCEAIEASDILKVTATEKKELANSSYAIYTLGNDTVSRKKYEIVFRNFYQ